MKPKKCCRNCEHLKPEVVKVCYGYTYDGDYDESTIIKPCKFSNENLYLEERCNNFKWQSDLRKLIKK